MRTFEQSWSARAVHLQPWPLRWRQFSFQWHLWESLQMQLFAHSAAGWGDPNWTEDAEVYDDGPEVPWGGTAESEDAFAARIWAEMERRRHAGVDAAAA